MSFMQCRRREHATPGSTKLGERAGGPVSRVGAGAALEAGAQWLRGGALKLMNRHGDAIGSVDAFIQTRR